MPNSKLTAAHETQSDVSKKLELSQRNITFIYFHMRRMYAAIFQV